jgi:hypothetical protein
VQRRARGALRGGTSSRTLCPVKRLLIPGAVLALASAATPTYAQNAAPLGALRGVVRSTLGDRIPYAVVALEPGNLSRFTDDSGSYRFPGVLPGTYHLRARQVGFKPFDTTVVLTGDSTVVVAAALEHLVVELEAHRTAWSRCRSR